MVRLHFFSIFAKNSSMILMKKILFIFVVSLLTLSCVKNNLDDIDISGEVYTEDFLIINNSLHDVKMHLTPLEGNPVEIDLAQDDTVTFRSYGRGEVLAAPFIGKLYIAYDGEEWVPLHAYTDWRKDITNPLAYDRKFIQNNYFQSTYSLEEADYNYWLKIKEEAEQ